MPHPHSIPTYHQAHALEHDANDAMSLIANYFPLFSTVVVTLSLIAVTFYFSWTKLVSSVRSAILNPQDKPGKKALVDGLKMARELMIQKDGKSALGSSTLPGQETACQ